MYYNVSDRTIEKMSYQKGKDIKVPFDCLWHCMTRSFRCEFRMDKRIYVDIPGDFEKW